MMDYQKEDLKNIRPDRKWIQSNIQFAFLADQMQYRRKNNNN